MGGDGGSRAGKNQRRKNGTFKKGYVPWNKGKKFSKKEREKYKFISKILKNPAIERKRIQATRRAYKNPKRRKEILAKISQRVREAHRKNPEIRKKMSRSVKKFWREHPQVNKKRVAKIKKYYREHPKAARKYDKPELRKKIDRKVTEWWREHPNIRKERSEKLKRFFIAHPEEFKKEFMNGKKNPFRRHIKTRKGFLVRSKGEKMIADFLFKHKIECRYEADDLLLDGWTCVPDFYLPSYDVYIEYYGGYPGSRQKKVMKNKLYKKYSVHCIFITPAELRDLRKYLLGDLEGWFGDLF